MKLWTVIIGVCLAALVALSGCGAGYYDGYYGTTAYGYDGYGYDRYGYDGYGYDRYRGYSRSPYAYRYDRYRGGYAHRAPRVYVYPAPERYGYRPRVRRYHYPY